MARSREPSDDELITQVLAGNREQYRFLVERHQRAMFNAAYRLVGNHADAADITQEAFLRAYHALDSFRVGAPLSPWLCRIAINLALNWLKRQRPTVSLDDDGVGAPLLVRDQTAGPQATMLRRERDDALRRAILALPPDHRAVIELRHFQELSYAEIAGALQISVATVKSRLFRARKQLREHLVARHTEFPGLERTTD